MSAPTPRATPRQVLWLTGLLAVLAIVVWMQFFRTTGSNAGASKVVAGAAQNADRTAALPVPQAVRLSDLDAVETLSEAGRNPFAYGARPAPPAPPVRPVAPPVPMTMQPALPPVPQGPPPIGLRLTGITVVEAGGRTMVTLKDPVSNAVFEAFEGDIVDGRYKVGRVEGRSVVLSYVDGTGVRTISLGG